MGTLGAHPPGGGYGAGAGPRFFPPTVPRPSPAFPRPGTPPGVAADRRDAAGKASAPPLPPPPAAAATAVPLMGRVGVDEVPLIDQGTANLLAALDVMVVQQRINWIEAATCGCFEQPNVRSATFSVPAAAAPD